MVELGTRWPQAATDGNGAVADRSTWPLATGPGHAAPAGARGDSQIWSASSDGTRNRDDGAREITPQEPETTLRDPKDRASRCGMPR
jgi:hypothetical protein